jgi:hypothetical protein
MYVPAAKLLESMTHACAKEADTTIVQAEMKSISFFIVYFDLYIACEGK